MEQPPADVRTDAGSRELRTQPGPRQHGRHRRPPHPPTGQLPPATPFEAWSGHPPSDSPWQTPPQAAPPVLPASAPARRERPVELPELTAYLLYLSYLHYNIHSLMRPREVAGLAHRITPRRRSLLPPTGLTLAPKRVFSTHFQPAKPRTRRLGPLTLADTVIPGKRSYPALAAAAATALSPTGATVHSIAAAAQARPAPKPTITTRSPD